MRILLLGKNGQVGWELQRALAPLGELVALDRNLSDGWCGDLSRPAELAATVRALRPDLIVNAAAYTAVDKAESEPELAQRINAEAVAVLAREAASLGAWLVHYSTDYVFDGSGEQARDEQAETAPLGVYGLSKRDGERHLVASGCQHLIFRTSWVYAARGANFAKTMLRLAADRERLTVIDDQVGAPTGAELIADVTAHALRTVLAAPALGGIYHLVPDGVVSWHGYACHVVERARQLGHPLKVAEIAPIPTSAYPTAARRPANSRLANRKLRESFSLHLPAWQQGVDRLLLELTP